MNWLTLVFLFMGTVAVFQGTVPRLYAAVIFVSLTMLHDGLFGHLDGMAYYGSAVLADLLIITITSGIYPIPDMVISLQRVCLASILLNAVGWLLWFAYLPPTTYNVAFFALYAWAIWIMLKKDSRRVGTDGVDSWGAVFRFGRRTSRAYLHRHAGKI